MPLPSLSTYTTPKFSNSYTDKEYDDAIKAIEENKIEIIEELAKLSLRYAGGSTVLAPLLPFLINGLGILPSDSLPGTTALLEKILPAIKQ